MPTDDARAKAAELGVDLVEVSPHARPPVCKIMDFGKYKYDEKKKKNAAKKAQTKVELKTIKLRPKTDVHDIAFKAKAARGFLEDGNKVQFEVRFRGRENAHPQTGRDALDKIMVQLADVAKLERAARTEVTKKNEDFWAAVKRISDQQRKLPEELRRMAGVPRQPFHAERLPKRRRQCNASS
jgi:translation initiation factor IF-3